MKRHELLRDAGEQLALAAARAFESAGLHAGPREAEDAHAAALLHAARGLQLLAQADGGERALGLAEAALKALQAERAK